MCSDITHTNTAVLQENRKAIYKKQERQKYLLPCYTGKTKFDHKKKEHVASFYYCYHQVILILKHVTPFHDASYTFAELMTYTKTSFDIRNIEGEHQIFEYKKFPNQDYKSRETQNINSTSLISALYCFFFPDTEYACTHPFTGVTLSKSVRRNDTEPNYCFLLIIK